MSVNQSDSDSDTNSEKSINSDSKELEELLEEKSNVIWKDFPHRLLKNKYEVSNTGLVRNKSTQFILKISTSNGYRSVKLVINKKTYSFQLHRVIAIAFKPPEDKTLDVKTLIVNHIDHNKNNNHVDNLNWMTQKQNINYSQEQGKIKYHFKQVIRIGRTPNEPDKIYDSVTEAGNDNGVDRTTVGKALTGHNPTAGGYKWKYAKDTREDFDLEDFVDIEGYPNYKVSQDGRVYTNKLKRLLKPVKNANGYYYVTLVVDKKKRNWYIHQLVAQTFLEIDEDRLYVNHKNRIKTDNRLENLEFVTASENMKHCRETQSLVTKSDLKKSDGEEERSSVE